MANDMRKKAKVEEFMSKGVKWCAEKLYIARRENESLRQSEYRRHLENYKQSHEAEECKVVKAINERMATLLIENGIRPVRLRITYRDCDCEHCENNGNIEGQEWGCYFCGTDEYGDGEIFREKEIIITTTESFYSYELAGNKLAGITGLFEAKDYDVIKVVDINTNEVLYEQKDSDEEEQQDEE